MRFLSLFSGIEAATRAWEPLGWECAAVAEVEPFPCALLKHHYPEVPNLGDVTKITADQIRALGRIDLVCGGFPCQDLSVAGKRKGLNNADGTSTRSGLFFDAMRIAEWAKPRWLFIENVPGMFSSNSGRDFAAVVGEMAGCEFDVPRDGWRNAGVVVGPRGLVEWTVLDAQYHGLAQRRKRVFIVRDSGDWASRPPIFLEPYRLQWHPVPSREKGQFITPTIRAGAANGGAGHGARSGDSKDELIVPVAETICVATGQAGAEMAPTLNRNHEAPYVASVSPTLRAGGNKTGGDRPPGTDVDTCDSLIVAHSLRGEGFDASEDGSGRGTPLVPVLPFDTTQITSAANYSNPKAGDPCHPLAAGAHAPAIAFPANLSGTQCASAVDIAPSMGAANPTGVAYTTKLHNTGSNNAGKIFKERATCLDANSPPPALLTATMVRRLTPEECEALQGFPRGHTAIPWRGKPADQCPDGPRYKSIGNSWAVPCARWIGERIEAVQAVRQASERDAA